MTEDFRRAHIFSQFGIDFCCGGGRPLQQACERTKADPEQVVSALESLAQSSAKADLHRHIHLENNILFPKALKLA